MAIFITKSEICLSNWDSRSKPDNFLSTFRITKICSSSGMLSNAKRLHLNEQFKNSDRSESSSQRIRLTVGRSSISRLKSAISRIRSTRIIEPSISSFRFPINRGVRDRADAYVFRQSCDLFKQLSVRVLHEDRRYVVIANEGSIAIGSYLAQNAAASLNRILKAQTASGEQPGLHVHPDGTTHAAH